MIGAEHRLIPLDLIFDYPVRWSRFKVLRDLVQNFYDALQYPEWEQRFSYDINENHLWLKAENVGFSYDWLIPIGASTKRENSGLYAGYFGEGFKIAALCAVRDHGWSVEMRSRNWQLTVVSANRAVDGHQLTSLAYRVLEVDTTSSDTLLSIHPFTDDALLRCVLLSFYYPGNPLLGSRIWESSEIAVYHRSATEKPAGYPSTYDASGPGIIFAGYQALGSFAYPLVFCFHDYHHEDRERSSFYKMDVVEIVSRLAHKLPAEASATVLDLIRLCWRDQPRRKYDFESWHPIVRILVNNVASSADASRSWKEQHPQLLVASAVKRSNIAEYNRRHQALDWLRRSGKRRQLVQEAFSRLGCPTLEEACQEDDGFSLVREATLDESRRIGMLEKLALSLLPELFEKVALPPCKVIKSERAVWQGMTSCVLVNGLQTQCYGEMIRFKLPYVAIKKGLLSAHSFGTAFSTYLHEIAHMFGGDRSASFSRVLSVFMEMAFANSLLVAEWQNRWENACRSTRDEETLTLPKCAQDMRQK